jgi:hypothetical protein
VIDAFGMKSTTEALKLGGQYDGISLVDLLSGIPPTTFRPAYRGMRLFDLV